MIQLDRNASLSIQEQLIAHLRYLIASGHWKSGELLPSTRELARQLDISFHTVRKAYQALEKEGLILSRKGQGYRVQQRLPLEKTERMEKGAQIVQDSLKQLIGLGLTESEIEYLFQEQLDLLESPQERRFIVVAESKELAELYAHQLKTVLHETFDAFAISHLDHLQDADYTLSPFPLLKAVQEALPHTENLGFLTQLSPQLAQLLAQSLPDDTIGILARETASIPPLVALIRQQTGFEGQIVAMPNNPTVSPSSVLAEKDLLLYTPATRQRSFPRRNSQRRYLLRPLIAEASLAQIKQLLPV